MLCACRIISLLPKFVLTQQTCFEFRVVSARVLSWIIFLQQIRDGWSVAPTHLQTLGVCGAMICRALATHTPWADWSCCHAARWLWNIMKITWEVMEGNVRYSNLESNGVHKDHMRATRKRWFRIKASSPGKRRYRMVCVLAGGSEYGKAYVADPLDLIVTWNSYPWTSSIPWRPWNSMESTEYLWKPWNSLEWIKFNGFHGVHGSHGIPSFHGTP